MKISSSERTTVLEAVFDMLVETDLDPSKVVVRTFHGVDLVLPGMSDMMKAFRDWEMAVAARPEPYREQETDDRWLKVIDL